MKEIKKKVTILQQYGKKEPKWVEVYGKDFEELFDNLRGYATGPEDGEKILYLSEVETVEVEEKKEEYNLNFAKPDWGKKVASDSSEEEI